MIEATQIHLQQQQQQHHESNHNKTSKHEQDFNFESEATLVRLALNALQGIQSSLLTIQTLTEAFRSDPADRTFHRIPSLWSRSSSTQCIGTILNSFALSGSFVFLLHKFVHFHQNPPFSLVNQAFSVAVGRLLEGYVSALDTLCASVEVRRSPSLSGFGAGGCLTSVVVHSEVTVLEAYLHTKELRLKIHALASICKIYGCVTGVSFEDMTDKAILEFVKFPRGGDLLTYLYTQLEFSDPVHQAVLKFLFLRSCEPYCRFIREWIYEAKISDPYKEFIVEYATENQHLGNDEVSVHFLMATIREEKDRVAVPCFLRHHLISLLRAGQQLQVLIKLRELCRFSDSGRAFEDVIPCWSGISSYHPTYASLLTFNKVKIESMVSARRSFYTTMDNKLENSFTKLEIRYPQVVRHSPAPVSVGTLDSPASSSLVDTSLKKSFWDLDTDNLDSDVSISEVELVDQLESSECSSVSSFEDENESKPLIENMGVDKRKQVPFSALRSALSVSVHKDMQKPPESNESKQLDILHEIDRTDPFGQFTLYDCNQGIYLSHFSASLEAKKQKNLYMPGTTYSDGCDDMNFSHCGLMETVFCNDREYLTPTRLHPSKSNVKIRNQLLAVLKEENSRFSNLAAKTDSVTDPAPDSAPSENEVNSSRSAISLQSWMLKQNRNFLSMNPMISKHSLFHLMSKPDENGSKLQNDLLSCFDFSIIEDQFQVCMKDVNSRPGPGFGVKFPLLKDSYSSASTFICCSSDELRSDEIDTLVEECKSTIIQPMVLQHQDVISGGRRWETMLAGSSCTNNDGVGDITPKYETMFEIPLDFIIDKCLLQEIKLQYKYVSRLTIKLLEEGFDLHDHLMALRRYHFMEVADWADLFITSLWHHKWYITGADKRISEIQGLLELSAQRSSCENDQNKNRLFVFIKGQCIPLSTSAIGVHSFDFIGLGYRVDWPVSIILTSGALEKYTDIFNFLVRVKLAVFALTDAWCSLKDLMHLTSANHNSKLHKMEVHQIKFLMKIRHLVNHFVCTLQQYVLSQLSHVSWCRFLHSLKDMVKDMMDFELVHMAYLSESLQICFLSSAETQSVSKAIENILQCALDFQSCLAKGTWGVSQDQPGSSGLLSNININKVLAINKRFRKELKELYLCYLKSPKHGDFGLFRFWEYLNYNEYYSNTISDEIGSFTFSA